MSGLLKRLSGQPALTFVLAMLGLTAAALTFAVVALVVGDPLPLEAFTRAMLVIGAPLTAAASLLPAAKAADQIGVSGTLA